MTTGPTLPQQISVDGQQAANLATMLRELERFPDGCDETIAGAIAEFFGLHPAAEAYSAAVCFHADTLEAALGLRESEGVPRRNSLTRGDVPLPGDRLPRCRRSFPAGRRALRSRPDQTVSQLVDVQRGFRGCLSRTW